jgi:hypothetical protein
MCLRREVDTISLLQSLGVFWDGIFPRALPLGWYGIAPLVLGEGETASVEMRARRPYFVPLSGTTKGEARVGSGKAWKS